MKFIDAFKVGQSKFIDAFNLVQTSRINAVHRFINASRNKYLELDQAGIHVAQYLTELPPKELLEEKLHKAIAIARQEYEAKRLGSAE